MPPTKKIRLFSDKQKDMGITMCPVCGHPVRRLYRDGKHLDSYKPAIMQYGWQAEELAPVDRETAKKLKRLRKGKKTVALVGMGVSSCALAPFEDKDVEIWAINEMHNWKWLKRADRWFQIHATQSWQRDLAKRNVYGHREWLMENPLNIPIYMQYWQEEVPKSIAYPLREVCAKFFKNIRRGDAKIKYFTSTFAYMMGVALLEEFDRIELYGFEMSATDEYIEQKGCAEWWMGLAMGLGVEIYLPPDCILMYSNLYGGDEQGAGWMEL
jgi:hypothetical protein